MRCFAFVVASFALLSARAQDAVVPFASSNLPIVVIDTHGSAILDEPKITADMGIIDNGSERNQLTDPFNNYKGKIGIEIRGSSSQLFPKKQYGIELRDDAGEGSGASLLGMPEEEDWVLFAPYNDKSLMRDALAYNLGRGLSGYAPRARYCEVVLNGVYQGVYVLIEKIKRDKNRVDLNKLDPDEISGNNLTGGYIFKIDKTTGGTGDGWPSAYKPPLGSNQEIYFQYEYPKAEDIAPEQKTYIQSYVRQFEDALNGNDFANPDTGYAKYMDVESFIDVLIIQELTRNVDGYRLSSFMYKKRDSDGGKIYMGPMWDFNLAFGNADYCSGGEPTGWALDFNGICNSDTWLIPFWWKKLFRDEAFGAKVAARWSALRTGTYTNERINARIDSLTALLTESQARNFSAWKVLGKYVWPNRYIGNSFSDEVTYLKTWIDQRLTWMDANMPGLITASQETPGEVSVSAAPNPFDGSVSIRYAVEVESVVNIRILDAMGRTVNSTALSQIVPGTHHYTWDASRNGTGLYYFQVLANDRLLGSGKLIRR
jgi:hypothetical protein